MGLGIAQPWMLPWLVAAVVPIVLAWLAMRRPRPVRFGATEFVARAARRQHVTRSGVSVPLTAVRTALVAAAALAAAGPFTTAVGRPQVAAGGRAHGPRVECVVEEADGDHDGTRAVRRAIEAVGTRQAGGAAVGRPEVVLVSPARAGRGPAGAPTLFVVGDGTIPAADDARRIAAAVADGAAVLVCLGPRSTAEPVRGRLSAWLDDLADAAVAGVPEPLEGAGIAVAPTVAPGAVEAAGFTALAGPTVQTLAPLVFHDSPGRDAGPPTVLARTLPGGRPLLVEVKRGRGTICIAAVPLSLAEQSPGMAAGQPWSDLAAWPVFVPLVDRLVDRLLSTASAATEAGGPRRLSLVPWLLALACGLLLSDWLLSAATGGPRKLQAACRAVAALALLAVCFGPGVRQRAADAPGPAGPHRGIVILLDRSPSMAAPDAAAPGPLDRAIAALTAGDSDGSPLARIARSRPVDLVAAAAETTVLGRWGREATSRALAAVRTAPPAAGSSRIGDAVADVARGILAGSRPAAIVVVTDGAITVGREWAEATRIAREEGVPLVVIPVAGPAEATPAEAGARSDTASARAEILPPASAEAPIRVLLVEAGPRFEWRFLERVLAADPAFATETCFLSPAEPAARVRTLPDTVAAWNAFDVVVLGDVALEPAGMEESESRADAWRSLAAAVSDDGLGIAWSPGERWWRSAAIKPAWLPAAPGGARGPLGPHRLRVREGEAAGGWLPAEPVDAEVFSVLHPVALAPSARVLAVAMAAEPAGAETVPAIVVDRLGAGTVLLHLCETWRWSRGDKSAFGVYWRGALRRLAEPHRLSQRLVATLDVAPLAAQVGEHVRVAAVPTRADIDLSDWQLELFAGDATSPAAGAVRRVKLRPDAGRRGAMTAVIDDLPAGRHAVRLAPPADRGWPSARELPAGEIVVAEPEIERPGAHADIGPLLAAARDSAGAVVSTAEIGALPERLEPLVSRAGAAPAGDGESGGWQRFPRHVPVHAAMLVAVAALTRAWWPVSGGRRGAPA